MHVSINNKRMSLCQHWNNPYLKKILGGTLKLCWLTPSRFWQNIFQNFLPIASNLYTIYNNTEFLLSQEEKVKKLRHVEYFLELELSEESIGSGKIRMVEMVEEEKSLKFRLESHK